MSNKAVIIDGVRSPIGTKGSPMIGRILSWQA